MSLIALTDRLAAGRTLVRSLLLLVAVTGAVIVGLLAMHSLNTHTGTDNVHSATFSTEAMTSAVAEHGGATAANEPCADCGASGHSDMLTMVCVLALLATVLLLARPRPGPQWLSVLPRPRPLLTRAVSWPVARPPSLTVLCISRT